MRITPKRFLALFLSFILAFSFQGMVFAASGDSCLTVTGTTEHNTTTGSLTKIELADVFRDSGNHKVTYSIVSSSVVNDFIKIQDNKLYFTASLVGKETIIVEASCSNGQKKRATFTFNVALADSGLDCQYNYNQTPAESVTVYVTVSSDGVPLLGNDANGTVLCHQEVTVPYFDLELYGLEDYYRYEHDESGSYCGDEVIERPTALHLYIYLLERYYFGLPESECCQGKQDLSETADDDVQNMWGEEAYSNNLSGLNITGSATSMYMQNFWGHDENLMYYRNHAYPLQRAGWGSTADYILLSENDTIDLAMFTNWGFYTHGAFLCLGDGESHDPVNDFTITAGETLTVQQLKFGTQAVAEGGVDNFLPMLEGASLYVASAEDIDNGNLDCMEMVENSDPQIEGSLWSYTFEEPGVYYLIGFDDNIGTEDACYAPSTAKVVVTAPKQELIITKQPETFEGKLNDAVTFSVLAEGDNLKYQWYYSSDNGKTWNASGLTGNKTEVLQNKLLKYRIGQLYRCEITDAYDEKVVSDAVTMKLAELPLTITKNPSDYSGKVGDVVSFTVEAVGTGLTYQWYYSSNGGASWSASGMTGAKTNTLQVNLIKARNGQMYRCVVKDANMNSVTSEAATIKLKADPVKITQHPSDVKTLVNQTAEFTVKASGESLTYQWYYSNDNGNRWGKSTLTGCTTATLSVQAKAYRMGQIFRCVVTDGDGNMVTSNSASLLEKEAGITIISNPESITNAVVGTTYTFTVVVSGENLSYQWYYSKDQGTTWYKSGMTGATTKTLSVQMTNARRNQMYRCQITDTSGRNIISEVASIQ